MLLVLAACAPANIETTPIATITPLPTATPDVVNAGQPNNPLRMVIKPADPEFARLLEARLEDEILLASSVTVDIVLVERYADALAALCETGTPRLSVVWLDGLGYLAAQAQNCGEVVLRIRRDQRLGEAGVVLLNATLGTGNVANLIDNTYCRLGFDDFYSWLLPSLLFRARNIDPARFEAIVDYDDTDALLTALARGDCAGAAVSQSRYNALVNGDDRRAAAIRIGESSIRFPHDVLMYPNAIPLAARLSLTEGLQALDTDLDADASTATPAATRTPDAEGTAEPESTAEADMTATPQPTSGAPAPAAMPTNLLAPFFGDGALIVQAAPEDFSELAAFIEETGLDIKELGN